MRLQVRNTDDRELPNLAVTVETEPSVRGDAPVAFGEAGTDTRLADADRPVWIVDRGPEGGDSAASNTWALGPVFPGPTGAESAYTNTWATGGMFPGETRDIEWRLTAVRPGTYTINYRIAPGLNGKAVPANGQNVAGSFDVTISDEPVPARVNDKGEVVRDPGGE